MNTTSIKIRLFVFVLELLVCTSLSIEMLEAYIINTEIKVFFTSGLDC